MFSRYLPYKNMISKATTSASTSKPSHNSEAIRLSGSDSEALDSS